MCARVCVCLSLSLSIYIYISLSPLLLSLSLSPLPLSFLCKKNTRGFYISCSNQEVIDHSRYSCSGFPSLWMFYQNLQERHSSFWFLFLFLKIFFTNTKERHSSPCCSCLSNAIRTELAKSGWLLHTGRVREKERGGMGKRGSGGREGGRRVCGQADMAEANARSLNFWWAVSIILVI